MNNSKTYNLRRLNNEGLGSLQRPLHNIDLG